MISEETRKKWNYKLSEIEDAVKSDTYNPSEWEEEFIDSVSFSLSEGKDLTMRQSICLNNIFERCL